MKRRYRVILPVEIDGQQHEYGAEVELTLDVAAEYAHALISMEGANDGRDG